MQSLQELRDILAAARTVAVVGASHAPHKAGHAIPRYLQQAGYRIVPINPRGGRLFGAPVKGSLADVREPIDIVNVFRPPSEAAAIARAAVDAGARVLWFQPGTSSLEGERIARDAGLVVVSEACSGVVHSMANARVA